MAITSSDIHNQSFSIGRRGYDVDEVDVFLEQVANEIDEMNAALEQLENDFDGGSFTNYEPVVVTGDTEGLKEELLRKDMFIADLKKELEEKKANDYAIAQALIIAQRSADEILNIAHGDAAQIRHDAELEAEDIINKANREKQDI
ncbi:MAG: DivIVA domain-containing protein, partial [Eggerthellaceae bacterium]|nr:DivIVA domain-containing protein [Eggerthellaceae bacterium]